MKATILAGTLAALTYGTAAMAEVDCPPKEDAQASLDASPQAEEDTDIIIEPEAEEPEQAAQVPEQQQEEGVGGAGEAGAPGQAAPGGMLMRCTPVEEGAGTGGSGMEQQQMPPPSGEAQPPESFQQQEPYPYEEGKGGSGQPKEKEAPNLRGLTVQLGGGVEGYTSSLAPQINPGPAVNVTAALKPSTVLGIELSYTGAVNNIDTHGGSDLTESGPDIVRNGGQAVATFAFTATALQPYLLGGVGFSDYNIRGGFDEGFQDDTLGTVPVGLGVRSVFGGLTADARVNYNFLFDQEFALNTATVADTDFTKGGTYYGSLNVGWTF
ncbi:hypothetical protein P2318_03070 [Myxococcaceae bacterium GXIMD 01537]